MDYRVKVQANVGSILRPCLLKPRAETEFIGKIIAFIKMCKVLGVVPITAERMQEETKRGNNE